MSEDEHTIVTVDDPPLAIGIAVLDLMADGYDAVSVERVADTWKIEVDEGKAAVARWLKLEEERWNNRNKAALDLLKNVAHYIEGDSQIAWLHEKIVAFLEVRDE